jgi:FMN-dependent NADH-azoreductase
MNRSQKTVGNILRIDSSARRADSVSREVGDEVVRRLIARSPGARVHRLDLAAGMPHIDEDWVGANFTPADQRSAVQRERLAASDEAVAALAGADAVVLTVPVYNFSVPSVLKAWIDHVCRAGLTFRYTAEGPKGLLADRPVYLVMASGGVPFGSPVDFASGYLRQVFRFLGIEDVRLVGAERVAADAAAARASALTTLEQWLPRSSSAAA